MSWEARTALLLGDENVTKLNHAHVLVMGLGGVGSAACEHLCRAGIGELTIVDGDVVNETNLNRQLPALRSNQGILKTDVMAKRLLDINPDLKLHVYPEYVKDQRMLDILKLTKYDFVVDAIDTFSPKTYLIVHCLNLGLRLVSSMGSGGKTNPMQVQIADIAQTHTCPLADALRKRLHKLGYYSGFHAVFSAERVPENAVLHCEDDVNKKSTVGTISYMPPIFGAHCASVVIRELIGEPVVSTLPIPTKIKQKIHHDL
ncbi:MAG: tRNA threonylcarbamoyladenosine dehydratase [Bacteroidales bacterium]|jgi:tRNA A37 threonylcarbamoyladenosine dehydratase|nr:tRNA threonylcarbamoyladenosine dehydratase [Bacteroidales bacterium]